jgi:hypothetical protein
MWLGYTDYWTIDKANPWDKVEPWLLPVFVALAAYGIYRYWKTE